MQKSLPIIDDVPEIKEKNAQELLINDGKLILKNVDFFYSQDEDLIKKC